MRTGIVGDGELGGSPAEWWTRAGHDVVVGSSPAGSEPATPADAAAFGEVVLFAPDWATVLRRWCEQCLPDRGRRSAADA
jgi:predicted dinucleotide-binding enzyme